MNLPAFVRSIFGLKNKGEDPTRQARWLPWYQIAGVKLTTDEALSLATVWACIDIIARNLGSCQWNIYEPVPGTKRRKLIDNDLRAWLLNTRPNPEMTAIGFREAMLFQAIPFGNAYAEIVPDRGGRIAELWPLVSERMTPRRDENWSLVYDYTQPDGSLVRFKPSQIYHVRGPGMWGLMGDNVIARAAKTLGLAAAQERFSTSFFGQGAQPIGAIKSPHVLDEPTYLRLKNDWAEKYKGPNNAHKPIILEAGMEFQSISIDPQKAQMTEDKKFSVEEICRWFGVPPHKVQHLEHATFSNIEHSSIEFVRDALRPWALRLSQEADAKFFSQTRGPWRYTEIDTRPLTLGDASSRSQAQASWRQNGIMTANEIRAMEGLDDIGDEGDVLLVQSNLTTVEKLIEPDEPQPAPGAIEPTEPDAIGSEDLEAEVARVSRGFAETAIRTTLARYGKRIKNRAQSISHKLDRAQLMEQFKAEQVDVVCEELAGFKTYLNIALGREFERGDALKFIDAFEAGVDFTFASEPGRNNKELAP